MSTIYIQRKSAVKSEQITGSIVDTTNVTNKLTNTYSARVIDILMNITTPVGSGMDYYGTEAPLNYMFADGRELSRTEYAELFSIIGTTYGAGDGVNTFNLPDKRERVSIMANHPKLDLMDMATKTLSDGSKWARIYCHNSSNGTVIFNSVEEVKNVQETNKYSRLYLLDDDRFKRDGKFEFMLCYPDNSSTAYNRWKQTNSPCNEYVDTNSKYTTEGYEAVSISWPTNWGGLARHREDPTYIETGGSYIKGNIGMTSWWFALAPFVGYEGGVPGYHNGTENVVITGRTELWVRYDLLMHVGRSCGASNNVYTPSGTVGGTAITKAQLPSYDLYNSSHTHTQNAHSHTQNAHTHAGLRWAGTGGKRITLNGGGVDGLNLSYGNNTQNTAEIYTANATASNQNTTATNQSTTIKVSSGGSGQTHTHSFTGSKLSINTIQKSLVCNYIIKVTSENRSIEDLLAEVLEGGY